MALVPETMQTTARRLLVCFPAGRSLLSWFRRHHRRYLASQHQHSRLLLAVQLLYCCLFGAWLLYSHTWPAPDIVALFLLLFAFVAARGLSFLRDWSPFVLLLLGYVALTGIAGALVSHAHVQFPIDADRKLFFGHLPTTELQSSLWHPGHLRWYDYLATILYPMHFVIPLVVAFAFWMWKKHLYWRFVASYLLLTYAGFVTYVLYPMAPPWWAANEGRIPPVKDILGQVTYGGVENPVVLATKFFQPNAVAAMPSIHAAFPVLVWLVLWKTWPKWGWAAVIYPLAMAFSVIYLGEHYFIDVAAGWLYAAVAFALVWYSGGWTHASRPPLGRAKPVPIPATVRSDPHPRRRDDWPG